MHVPCADKERRERCQHCRRAGEPHAGSDPGRRRQLVRATHRAAAGHSGRPASGPEAWKQRVGWTELQQGTSLNTRITQALQAV